MQRWLLLTVAAAAAAHGSGQADPLYDPYDLSGPTSPAPPEPEVADAASCRSYQSYFLIVFRNLSLAIDSVRNDRPAPLLLSGDWTLAEAELQLLSQVHGRHMRVEQLQDLSSLLQGLFANLSSAREPQLDAGSRSSASVSVALLLADSAPALACAALLTALLPPLYAAASRLRPLTFLLLLLLLLSVTWSWVRLYKQETVKKQRELMNSLESSCKPDHEIGVWQSLRLWARSTLVVSPVKDSCLRQMEALAVDPVWEVSPVDALADTLARFVLKPLKLLAEQLNHFFRTLVADLPLWLTLFILLFVLFFSLVLLLLCFGYRLRVPFLLEVGPCHSAEQIENRSLRRQVQELQHKNEELHRQLQPHQLPRSLSIAGDSASASPSSLRREREVRLRPSRSESNLCPTE